MPELWEIGVNYTSETPNSGFKCTIFLMEKNSHLLEFSQRFY